MSYQGAAIGVALLTDQLEDLLGVPDIVGQQLINDGFERTLLARPGQYGVPGRRGVERCAHCSRSGAQCPRDGRLAGEVALS